MMNQSIVISASSVSFPSLLLSSASFILFPLLFRRLDHRADAAVILHAAHMRWIIRTVPRLIAVKLHRGDLPIMPTLLHQLRGAAHLRDAPISEPDHPNRDLL